MPRIQVFVKTDALQEISAMIEKDKLEGASSRDANISSKAAMLLELGLRVYRLRTQEVGEPFNQMAFNEMLLANVLETRQLTESLVEGVYDGVNEADANANKESIVSRVKRAVSERIALIFPKEEGDEG